MGITKSSGSLSTTSSPLVENERRVVNDPQNVRPTPEKRILDRPWTDDTFANQNALNTNRQSRVIEMMKGYVEGTPLRVTYFHQMTANTNTKEAEIDPSGLHNVHQSWLQINNFEFKLTAGMQFGYDQEKNQSTYSGEGTTYPGMCPIMGDKFFYEVEPGHLIIFMITEPPQRLSIKSGTCHHIVFAATGLADADDIEILKQSVREVAWFSKRKFLTNESALLRADEVILMEDIDRLYVLLTNYYQERFFERMTYRTFVRPDKIYDPYLVDFLLKTTSLLEFQTYPLQLFPNPPGSALSIWTKLLYPDRVDWDVCLMDYQVQQRQPTYRDVRMNALINRPYLVLNTAGVSADAEDGSEWGSGSTGNMDNLICPYPCICPCSACSPGTSNPLFPFDGDKLSDYGMLLMTYFDKQQIIPHLLIDLCTQYHKLSNMDQFYRIPVYMFLLTKLKQAIVDGVGDIKYDSPTFIPSKHKIDQEQITEDGLYSVDTNGAKVIGIVVTDGKQYLFTDRQVVYDGNMATVNLKALIDERQEAIEDRDWSLFYNTSVVEA